MAIPKIIHQTYKDHTLPEIYAKCQTEIKRLHPDFEYRFYTDNDMDKLIKKEFPSYYDKFNELPRMIMKIDMFRYFLMYKYGGIYADMDYLMLKPFDLFNYNVVLPYNSDNNNNLGNCFFASIPNHPYWKQLIDTLFTETRNKIDDGSVLSQTGPSFVTKMWKQYSDTDIYTPVRSVFHPKSESINNKVYINKIKEEGSYGMHICTGLWRNNKL
jgi:mannosyltransferase OCH1-like enzyme